MPMKESKQGLLLKKEYHKFSPASAAWLNCAAKNLPIIILRKDANIVFHHNLFHLLFHLLFGHSEGVERPKNLSEARQLGKFNPSP